MTKPTRAITRKCDVLVIGAGLAGLSAALAAAAQGARVLVMAKDGVEASNSAHAQGGIAAAVGPQDSARRHEQDTLAVGGGLNWPQAVEVLTTEGSRRIADLIARGAAFSRDGSQLQLGLEAGHSVHRIIHAGGGATGRVIMDAMRAQVLAHPRIQLVPAQTATALLVEDDRVQGARFVSAQGVQSSVQAQATILATGGLAGIYAHTTNPPGTRGEGVALAYRAGAEIIDLEFVQFHPTALVLPNGRHLLLSEALRGAGAHVVDAKGRRFLSDYDPRGELAPRDVVARAIFQTLQASGQSHAYLTLRHLDPELIHRQFAALAASCRAHGLDLARDWLPIAPAAHYMMGGVWTDLDGRTTAPGLYAAGEVACTGVHGANRLASNSLLECLVFGTRAGQAATRGETWPGYAVAATEPTRTYAALAERAWQAIGILREATGLAAFQSELGDPAVLAPSELTAYLVAQAATLREESRGAHYRSDFPNSDPDWEVRIVLRQGARPRVVPVDTPPIPAQEVLV